MDVNAILLKPLDGKAVGSPGVFEAADFERLEGMGAVRRAGAGDPLPDVPPADTSLLDARAAQLRIATLEGELNDARRDLAAVNARVTTLEQAARVREAGAEDGSVTGGEKMLGAPANKMATPPANKKG